MLRNLLKVFVLFVLVLLLVVPLFAQEVEETAVVDAPAVEVVDTAGEIVAAPAPVEDATPDWLTPEVLTLVGGLLFAIGLGCSFYVILKALEALKVSVPQEVITTFGNQLIETINQTRQTAKIKAQETDTPIDDLFVYALDIPAEVIVKIIEKKTGSVPIELMTHLGLAEELPPAAAPEA